MTTPPGAHTAADLAQIAADIHADRQRRSGGTPAPAEPTAPERPIDPRAADLRQIEADLAANRR